MAKIVFCEDDRLIRKLIRIALRSTPHEVHIAGDGAEGLELIERERPDVVFTDVSMPELDGIQLVDEIKSRPHLKHIPIILVTASAQRYRADGALHREIADYLNKPFNVEDLLAKIEKFASGEPTL